MIPNLPRDQRTEHPEPRPARASGSSIPTRPTVLVVEDDDDTRQFLLLALDGEFTVSGAADGLEAITAVKASIPDIVISDVMMPNADGYDLLEYLQSDPATSDVPVILLSAGADESSERTRGLELGARDYLAKPLDLAELLARIRIHLQLAQSRQAAQAQIRQLTDRLIDAQDKERKRIARDLHDHIGQQLTALRFQLEILRGISREAALVERIEETQTIAQRLDSDIDFLTWELHSAALESVDIVGALANYVSEWSKRFGVIADFQIKNLDQGRLSPEVKTNLYRVVQESLHNVSKHARATTAQVLIMGRRDNLELIVEDDGIGFDAFRSLQDDDPGTGIGLVGMKERAALMGAQFAIESTPGHGCKVSMRIPLGPASAFA